MAIDQRWALNCLRHNRNSCLLTLASMTFLGSDATSILDGKLVVLRPNEMIFDAVETDRVGQRLELDLSQFSNEFKNNRNDHLASLGEYWRHVRRNLIKESFEVTKAYSLETNQESALKTEAWYPFARMIRNSVSHDMHFRFNAHDLKKLPVSYLHVTLDATLNDTEMKQDHLDPFVTFKLFSEMETFVKNH